MLIFSFPYLLFFLLTFSPPRPWLFAEIKNDKELLPPPCPTPTFHLPLLSWEDWGQGLLLKTQERRMGVPWRLGQQGSEKGNSVGEEGGS